jgi:hypothetical protein
MDSKITLDSIAQWEASKEILSTAYELEYIADTWPKRLPIEDLIILQSFGQHNGFNTWKTCLLHAANTGEIPAQAEHWFSGDVEPSRFWTGKKPKNILIPPCQKHKGDNVAFFSGELVTKYTVNPKDFAEYLKQQGKKPSKYIAAWFGAYGVEVEIKETDKTSDETAEPELGRRERQIDKICKMAKSFEYDLLDIPEGGKAKIKAECLKDRSLFTVDGFKRAWNTASKDKIISIRDKEKYL